MKLRSRLHRQLDLDAWEGSGVSPLNRVVLGLVIISIILAMLETEKTLNPWNPWFMAANTVLATVFAVEYALRLWVRFEAPNAPAGLRPLAYAFRWYALLDLAAVALLWLDIVFGLGSAWAVAMRLARILRIFTLTRHSAFGQAMRGLMRAIASRKMELGLSFGITGLALMASAIGLYLAERNVQPEAFGSIPRAMWWAIATLTTVGYGDVYPITALGKVIASVSALSAVAIVALPAGILAAALSDIFQSSRRNRGDPE
jgi:voltage-gated potassium channel